MADKIARHSPTAVRYYKASMNSNADARLDEKYYVEIGFSEKFIKDEDFREACTAFLEKRKANYTGN
jgi:enoyl-CoA hydratase/carnithine racemase